MKQENMTRWEPLTLLFAIKTLVEENKGKKALDLIQEVISEIKKKLKLEAVVLAASFFI